jgi:alkaline phosphatase D
MIFGGDETTDHDAEFALHLGDYIYEYAANGYASSAAAGLGRVCLPANEWLTLADYRA